MKNIRIFIVCSSVFLVAWLAASYSTQLDHSGASVSTETAADTVVVDLDKQEEKDNTTASFAVAR